ncbi:hypothetical protein HII36_12745 [Nonomuraea sp. NN258]|uniref:DUF6049 family protein n=1 Tax=Nonomuraea antri TaxID=2730852 RepID=UPI001568480C|nr:DUF6049 family protein [Nonomuraea antri]NRQ32700.1 hypothetical protein [Nonomuraea antri]
MIRKAALLAALSAALLAPLVAATPTTAAANAPAVTQANRQSIAVSITSITPEVPKTPNDEIKISGVVRNDTGAPLSWLRVQLRYTSQRFADRTAMAAYHDDPNAKPPLVSESSFVPIQALAAGASVPFEIVRTPAQLGLTSFGVYPVAVEVAQSGVGVVAQKTFLTYAPPMTPALPKNRLAIALPVIDQPHRADGSTFFDDKLSQSLTGKGRLADLARIAQTAPKSVTWFFEPALLDDVQAMTRKYTVKTKKETQEKPADPNAAQWLQSMRTSLAASPVVATPYADPDITALAHQGLDGQTSRAIELGGQTARSLLNRNAQTTTNWPPAGVLDADALDLLAVSKDRVDRVLLNATNLPPQTPTATTPDAASTIDTVNGPVTALVADPELSRLFEPTAPTTTLLSTQRFIAETAMIATEPGQTLPRSLVVAPSRRWNPNPTLVSGLLRTAARLPWLTLTPLNELQPSKASVPRSGPVYTDQNRGDELSAKYLEPVKDVAWKAQLTSLITADKRASGFDTAVLRLTSSAWRTSTRTGRGATKLVDSVVEARTDKIQITGVGPDRPRTLAGRNGEVPISVKNGLDSRVTLKIDVKSNNPELLSVDIVEKLTIEPGQSGTIQVRMQVPEGTSDSGDATVSVQLLTADGQPYGEAEKLTIRTTGYTGIALVIVGAALTVMLAAVVLRILRRRSERRLARAAKLRESEAV